MHSSDSANPAAVNASVTSKTYFHWTVFHGAPQLVCKELNTQEVLLVLFSIYSQGMVMFIEAGENPQALILNDSPDNLSKDI